MNQIKATWPVAPRTNESKNVAIVYAVILIIMTTAQLFSFEKFAPLIESFDLPRSGFVIAALLVSCGVFALPFLLQMKLSVGFRWFSMIAGWVVPALWMLLMLQVNVQGIAVDTIGLLGASVTVMSGWWTIFVVLGLGVLAAWSAWGLWPKRHGSLEHRRKKCTFLS